MAVELDSSKQVSNEHATLNVKDNCTIIDNGMTIEIIFVCGLPNIYLGACRTQQPARDTRSIQIAKEFVLFQLSYI